MLKFTKHDHNRRMTLSFTKTTKEDVWPAQLKFEFTEYYLNWGGTFFWKSGYVPETNTIKDVQVHKVVTGDHMTVQKAFVKKLTEVLELVDTGQAHILEDNVPETHYVMISGLEKGVDPNWSEFPEEEQHTKIAFPDWNHSGK